MWERGTALVNGEFTEEEAKGNGSKQVQKILSKIQPGTPASWSREWNSRLKSIHRKKNNKKKLKKKEETKRESERGRERELQFRKK